MMSCMIVGMRLPKKANHLLVGLQSSCPRFGSIQVDHPYLRKYLFQEDAVVFSRLAV